MIVGGKDASLCNMIAFFVNIFCGGALGTIADNPKSLKFITDRLCHIAVIDMNDRFRRNHLPDLLQISCSRGARNAFFEMPSEAFHNIYFFDRFMEIVRNIGEQAALGS